MKSHSRKGASRSRPTANSPNEAVSPPPSHPAAWSTTSVRASTVAQSIMVDSAPAWASTVFELARPPPPRNGRPQRRARPPGRAEPPRPPPRRRPGPLLREPARDADGSGGAGKQERRDDDRLTG